MAKLLTDEEVFGTAGSGLLTDEQVFGKPGKKKDDTSKATASDYAAALSNAIGEGVFGIQGGLGSFAQAPAANMLASAVGGAALSDRGITSLANWASPGSAQMSDSLQEHAQLASRYAADTRAENVDAEGGTWLNPRTALARTGLALQEDARKRTGMVQADNRANNPALVAQQNAVSEAEGFLPKLGALATNPLATAYTLARSAPDMLVGLGAAKIASSRVMAGAGAAADAAAARVAAAGGDAAAQAAAAQAAVASVGSKAVARASTTGMLAEATSSANSTREGVFQNVMAIPEEKLATAPRYQAALRETGGDAARARQIVANELADQAPLLAATGTAAGTLITNRLFRGDTTAKAIVGQERLTARDVLKNVGQEATEEGLQGVPEDFAQYGATSQADPTKKFDLGGTLAENMAAGAIMGGGGTSARYAQQRAQDAHLRFKETGKFVAPGQTAATPPPAAFTGDAAPVSAGELLGTVEAPSPAVSEAEKSLMTPRALTTLDRVNEIDKELGASAPDAPGVAALQAERTALTKDWPLVVPGLDSSFSTEAGARVEARYSLVDADSLLTSHDENLRQNPAYPQELQPRERDRAASAAQISGIVQKLDPARLGLSPDAANGAPIIGADGLVESGNARTIALKRIYQANGQKAEDYKTFLRDNAAQFGLTPEAIDGMAKPVLVRVRTTPVNRAEFARQANASTVAQMSPSEQARSDSARIDSMEDLRPDDSGEFSTSRDFIKRFMTRLRNAVLAKAYGDSPVLVRMVESMDDNARNITKALMIAAPRVAQARQAIGEGARFDADLTSHLVEAAQEIGRLKDAGTSVADALAQIGLMGETYAPETATMLQFLSDNARRPRRIADFIAAYYDALDAVGDPRQDSMFGAPEAPAKGDLMAAARRTTEAANDQAPTQNPRGGLAGENQTGGGPDATQPANAPGNRGGSQGDGSAGPGTEQGTEAGAVGDAAARNAVRAEFTNALGDLAQIASKFSRAAMVPEATPDLMPTLVRLFKAGIQEVGYGMKDLLAYVKAAVKADPRLKTFWNKIGNDLYQKAARQALNESQAGSDDLIAGTQTDEDRAVIHARDTSLKLAAKWQAELGPDVQVVLGGSLVSQTFVRTGDEPYDMDIRFLAADPAAVVARVEKVTGLSLRKSIPVNDFPVGTSTGHMVEGVIEFDGIPLEVEGCVRSPAYAGWAGYYSRVFTTNELADFRVDKRALKGDKKAYKARKNAMLLDAQSRVIARGLIKPADYKIPDTWTVREGAPYLDEHGFERAVGLTSVERFAEQSFYDRIREDRAGMIDKYLKTFPTTVDADLAKELSGVYAENRAFANAVHEPSSLISKEAWAEALLRDTGGQVIITAGGAGSGKSASGKLARGLLSLPQSTLTFDSALTSNGAAVKRVNEAVAAGKHVSVIYTNTDAETAFGWSLGRERLMRASRVADSHTRAAENIRTLSKQYANDPRVTIVIVNNPGEASLVNVGNINDVPSYDYNTLDRKLHEIARKRSKSGRLERVKSDFVLGLESAVPGPVERQVGRADSGQPTNHDARADGGVRQAAEAGGDGAAPMGDGRGGAVPGRGNQGGD